MPGPGERNRRAVAPRRFRRTPEPYTPYVAQPRSLNRTQQRQIELTTAVCQERLLVIHVRHVLALVDLVSDRLPFDDALDIYVRILNLTPEQARNVGSRALASLGRRTGVPGSVEEIDFDAGLDEDGMAEESSDGGAGRSDAVFARMRKRIRGRVQEDLRNRINLAAARAEDAIFNGHVANSLIFAKALADDMSFPEAVELYLERMLVQEGMADVIYNRALSRVAEDVLPPVQAARGPSGDRQANSPPAPLRVEPA